MRSRAMVCDGLRASEPHPPSGFPTGVHTTSGICSSVANRAKRTASSTVGVLQIARWADRRRLRVGQLRADVRVTGGTLAPLWSPFLENALRVIAEATPLTPVLLPPKFSAVGEPLGRSCALSASRENSSQKQSNTQEESGSLVGITAEVLKTLCILHPFMCELRAVNPSRKTLKIRLRLHICSYSSAPRKTRTLENDALHRFMCIAHNPRKKKQCRASLATLSRTTVLDTPTLAHSQPNRSCLDGTPPQPSTLQPPPPYPSTPSSRLAPSAQPTWRDQRAHPERNEAERYGYLV